MIDQARRLVADRFPDALAVVLAGSTAVERLVIAGGVLRDAADLLCDHHRAWVGGGKWLPRRLLAADRELGATLLDGYRQLCETGSAEPLAEVARRVLELVGGPLSEGYRRTWTGVIERVV
ncbi:hypothetical protein ACH4E7_44345 [Kitasatospora sp. NPDC018058]|uniref:hypothetical protein n=1 Tax=Kitasatospora sp. NPDC018058 TaxID=3364025 RepID=UPI0037C06D9D